MSSPQDQSTPQGLSTFEALQYQKAQEEKRQKAAADAAYFKAVQDQFRQEQAKAAAEGKILNSQTITTNEQGGGTIQSEYYDKGALGRTNLDINLPGRYISNAPIELNQKQALQGIRSNELQNIKQQDQQARAAKSKAESDVRLANAYENFKINQENNNPGEYTAYGRTPIRYSVELQDQLSGGPYRYEVALNDSLSSPNSPRTEEARVAVAKPTGNFLVDFANNAAAEFKNMGEGISFSLGDLFGGRKIPQTIRDNQGNIVKQEGVAPKERPTVEGAVYSALSSSKSSSIKGGFTLITPQSVGELGKIGAEIQENPGGGLGSLAASAALIGLTAGAGAAPRAAKAIVQTARTAKTSSKVAQIVQQASKEVNQGAAAIRAIKITDTGDVIALREGPAGFVKEPISIPTGFGKTGATARVNLPGAKEAVPIPEIGITKRATFDKLVRPKQYLVEDKEGRDIGLVNADTGDVFFYGEPLPLEQQQALVEGGPLQTSAETTTDLFQVSRPEAPQVGNIVRIEGGAVAKTPVIFGPAGNIAPLKGPVRLLGAPTAAELMGTNTGTAIPEKLTTVIQFKGSKLAKTAADTAKRERQIESAKVALNEAKNKEVRPFSDLFKAQKAEPANTSNRPLETIEAFAFDRELSGAGKQVAKMAATSAKASKTTKPAIPAFTLRRNGESKESLGFGGATGAERVTKAKNRNTSLEEESVILPYPLSSKEASSTRTQQKLKIETTPKSADRIRPFSLVSERTESKEQVKTVPVATPKPFSDFMTIPQARTRQEPRQTSITTPFEATRTTPKQINTPIAIPKPKPTPPPPRTVPRVPVPKLGFGGYALKGKKSKGSYTGISNLSVANIAAPSFSIATGKGDQAKAASKLLGGSSKSTKGSKKKKQSFKDKWGF